ncbi:hypothetical protein BMG05_21635 [Mycobacterium malmoense]|nr:hypothetical protein BMG05_21635 [Mycobacterium malmoense]
MVVELAARPHISAGVALAAASVIAAGSIAQHLPGLHVAEHLPTVNVADINLTDASSMMDLFSGVETEFASLASGASAAAVPADVLNLSLPVPIQTWVTTFENAGANLREMGNLWAQVPAPVLQQVAANFTSYASTYVGSFQTSAANALSYFTGTGPTDFIPLLQNVWADVNTGNIQAATKSFFSAIWTQPYIQLGLPLEQILQIPVNITQNLANATKYLADTAITQLGTWLLTFQQLVPNTLGPALQAVYDANAAGDPLAAVADSINVPGVLENGILNGNALGNNGILSVTGINTLGNGLLAHLLLDIPHNLAGSIVAPGAVNIANGGSLASAIQTFANQLIGGWPSLSNITAGLGNLAGDLTGVLQNIPSVLAGLPTVFGNIASTVGTLLVQLLRLL